MLNNPENQKIFKCMLRTMENMNQSFLYLDKHSKTPFFANEQAIRHFSDKNGVIDVERIFMNDESPTFLRETITEQLNVANYVMLHDIIVTNTKGESQSCEVQVGYSDDEKNILFIEIFYH